MKKIVFLIIIGSLAFSCKKKGCTSETATNFDSKAKKDDGSCIEPETEPEITELDCSLAINNSIPSSFDDINYCYVKNNETSMTNNYIVAVDTNGQYMLGEEDILLYKTNEDRYGKLEILGIDSLDNYKLTFRATTFNNDGTVYKEKNLVEVRGTFDCDLDELQEVGEDFR